MTESQSKKILDRETIDTFVQQHLTPTIEMLREIVDYGVVVLDTSFAAGGTISDLVVIGHFFKHSLSMLDAVEILLSRGAIFAAGTPARSMLETYIYIEWLLKKDTDRRAQQFYVWHLRQKRLFARRFMPGTDEHKEYEKEIRDIADSHTPERHALLEQEARRQDKRIGDLLSGPKYKLINDEFDRLKKRPHDVAWYCPWGPSSIADMTTRLKLESQYEYFYSHFSDVTHAGAFERNIKFDGKAVILEPIRSPEQIQSVAVVTSTLAFRIFRLILKKYLPSEEQTFVHSYVTKWRKRFLTVPHVVVTESKKAP